MRNVIQARWLLWRRNPHCHWCGILTYLPPSKTYGPGAMMQDHYATYDHLYAKNDPRRVMYNKSYNVLACFKCNVKRGHDHIMVGVEKNKKYWEEKRKEMGWTISSHSSLKKN